MTDRPMIFSAPMVRSLLRGSKIQTRRILSPRNTSPNGGTWSKYTGPQWETCDWDNAWIDPGPSPAGNEGDYLKVDWPCNTDVLTARIYPKFFRGDRFLVREAWGYDAPDLDTCRRGVESDGVNYGPYYMADRNWADNHTIKTLPPIYMPRWASRITLTVTDVRVQRVQDISEDDAIAEGVGWHDSPVSSDNELLVGDPQAAFSTLWESIHGPGLWALNPWIVALTFTVAKGNIDG